MEQRHGQIASASELHFHRTMAAFALLAVSPFLAQYISRGAGVVASTLGLIIVVALNPAGFVELAGFMRAAVGRMTTRG